MVKDELDYKKEIDISLWKKLIKYLSVYKKDLIKLSVFLLGIGGIDAAFPLFTKYAVDNFIVGKNLTSFAPFCATLIICAVFQSINIRYMIKLSGKLEASLAHDIRVVTFKKLQELPLSYYDHTPTGWIMSRMTSDIKRLGFSISWHLVDIVWSTLNMILMLMLMFILNWQLALIILAALPVLIVISLYFQRLILTKYRQVRKLNSHVTNAFSEGIMGAKTVKTIAREKEQVREFSGLTKDFRGHSVKAATISSLYAPVIILLASITTAAVLWKGSMDIGAGVITLGTLLAFVSYTTQFFEPVRLFGKAFNELLYTQASAERVFNLIDTDADIFDNKDVVEKYGEMFDSSVDKWPEFKGNISFRNVRFHIKNGEIYLLIFA